MCFFFDIGKCFVCVFSSRYMLLNGQPIWNYEKLENFAKFSFLSYILILNNYVSKKMLKVLFIFLCLTTCDPKLVLVCNL